MKSKDILEMVVRSADSKRAEDIVALDMEKVSLMADYFVIMNANSTRQVAAISDAIVAGAHKQQVEVKRVEGKNAAQWILIDLGDVIVHVFQTEQRSFYNLEKLWSEAPLINLTDWVAE